MLYHSWNAFPLRGKMSGSWQHSASNSRRLHPFGSNCRRRSGNLQPPSGDGATPRESNDTPKARKAFSAAFAPKLFFLSDLPSRYLAAGRSFDERVFFNSRNMFFWSTRGRLVSLCHNDFRFVRKPNSLTQSGFAPPHAQRLLVGKKGARRTRLTGGGFRPLFAETGENPRGNYMLRVDARRDSRPRPAAGCHGLKAVATVLSPASWRRVATDQ